MIVIDAGHGGDDPGASGNGIVEKDMNLKISKYMYDRFQELEVPVKITRESDITLTPTERVNRVLNAFGNNPNVIVLSNHLNAGGGEGAEVIYALRDTSTFPNLILKELAKEGQIIRKAYQRRLPTDTSKDYYFMQRDTGFTQPLTIEYGFLDNSIDAVKIKANYENYAEAVVRATMDYLDLPYIAPEGANVYVVQAGDSLWSIAKKFNITVEELKAANNLSSNLLSVGQILKIPQVEEIPKPEEYVVYTVVAGDNLYAIARKYNTTVDRLVSYNNLSTTNLKIGQQIFIPSEEVLLPVTEQDYLIYEVQSGDNLYAIARRYNTTVKELMSINNLSTSLLNIGQELKIPIESSVPSGTTYIDYIVKSGDNLYAIAAKYNTTVSELMNYNNLTSNLLSIGQVIKIPTEETPITYTVKSGDNLYAIAQKYNTTVNAIKNANNLTSNDLSIGQVLIIIPL